jgi:hypothetical protein
MNDVTDVLVEVKRLQWFFRLTFKDKEENKLRESILACPPISCNYEYNPRTFVTELCSVHPCTSALAFHLKLKFCAGCEIRLSRKTYDELKQLSNIQSNLLGRQRLCPPKRHVDKGFSFTELLASLKLI